MLTQESSWAAAPVGGDPVGPACGGDTVPGWLLLLAQKNLEKGIWTNWFRGWWLGVCMPGTAVAVQPIWAAGLVTD